MLAAGTVNSIEQANVPFCYLTSIGRRTGNAHTIEIWFASAPSARTLYILTFASSDTVRNIRKDARVTVRLAGEEYAATARLVDAGTEEDARARRLVVDKYQAAGAADLESWGAGALLVAFDLS